MNSWIQSPGFGQADRSVCPAESMCSAVNLPCFLERSAGKWDKSSPVWRENCQQSVLKEDGAEWLFSQQSWCSMDSSVKPVCNQNRVYSDVTYTTEIIFPKVVKSQGLMSQILARKVLLTVWNQVLKALFNTKDFNSRVRVLPRTMLGCQIRTISLLFCIVHGLTAGLSQWNSYRGQWILSFIHKLHLAWSRCCI